MAGFGNSPLPDDDFSNTIDLAEVIAAAGFSETVLVGASMGGRVALDAALAFPDRVAGLVLVGSALAGHDWSLEAQAYDELEEAALDSGDLDAAAAINVSFWVDGPQRTSREVDADLRRRVHDMQRRAFELQIDAPEDLEEHPLVPDAALHLATVACPTLVIVGSLDRLDMLRSPTSSPPASPMPAARRSRAPPTCRAWRRPRSSTSSSPTSSTPCEHKEPSHTHRRAARSSRSCRLTCPSMERSRCTSLDRSWSRPVRSDSALRMSASRARHHLCTLRVTINRARHGLCTACINGLGQQMLPSMHRRCIDRAWHQKMHVVHRSAWHTTVGSQKTLVGSQPRRARHHLCTLRVP